MSDAPTASAVPAPNWPVLIERARAVMLNAYVPYSQFPVGAALQTAEGQIFEGCNVENAAYGVGICAERSAISAAVSHGFKKFVAIVVSTKAETPTPPCGMCRQVLEEFAPDLPVLSITSAGAEARWTMKDLLPAAFTPTSLSHT